MSEQKVPEVPDWAGMFEAAKDLVEEERRKKEIAAKIIKSLTTEIDQGKRIAELEAENAKLRDGLEAAAEVLKGIGADHRRCSYIVCDVTQAAAVKASRACWAALGKGPL